MLVFSAIFAGIVALALTAVLSWYWFYYPWILTIPALIFVAGECARLILSALESYQELLLTNSTGEEKQFLVQQGRIHGNPVADGWAGAVVRKPLVIQKCDQPTDRRTDGGTKE